MIVVQIMKKNCMQEILFQVNFFFCKQGLKLLAQQNSLFIKKNIFVHLKTIEKANHEADISLHIENCTLIIISGKIILINDVFH